MTDVELLIFDCDGVLIDSEMLFYNAYASSLQELGCPVSARELADRFSGFSGTGIVCELAEEIPEAVPSDFHQTVAEKILMQYHAGVDPMPEAAYVLRSIKSKKCVASSAGPTKLALGLIQAGLYDLLYPHVFSSILIGEPKPSPDIFLHAAREMDTSAQNCLVVEDSVAGVTAAKAAGMPVVGFVGGTHCSDSLPEKLIMAGASRTLNQLSELLWLSSKP